MFGYDAGVTLEDAGEMDTQNPFSLLNLAAMPSCGSVEL